MRKMWKETVLSGQARRNSLRSAGALTWQGHILHICEEYFLLLINFIRAEWQLL